MQEVIAFLMAAHGVGFVVSVVMIVGRWQPPDPLACASLGEFICASFSSWTGEMLKAFAWPIYIARPW